MEEAGLPCVCQTIAKSIFPSVSQRSPFFFEVVIQSRDKVCPGNQTKSVWWLLDCALSLSANSSRSVFGCSVCTVGGIHLQ